SYLYDASVVPTDLTDEALIRSEENGEPHSISTSEFMSSGAGRFAVGAMSPLIQAFFETTAASQLEPGSYSKAEMATFLGLTYYGFAFQAYEFADGTDDIVERTFVFNSQKFRINDSAVFVVEADGTRHIDNFWIEPDQ